MCGYTMLWLLFQYCWMRSTLAACKQSRSGNGSIICWVYFGYFSNSTRGGSEDEVEWGGGFELERIPLQRLSKHHFNSKHLLGVLNWHLLRCGMHKRSFTSPLSLLPSSPFVTSLFTPIFLSPLLPAILLSPISLLPLPPSVWTGTTPPTLMNASASLFPCNYVRPT